MAWTKNALLANKQAVLEGPNVVLKVSLPPPSALRKTSPTSPTRMSGTQYWTWLWRLWLPNSLSSKPVTMSCGSKSTWWSCWPASVLQFWWWSPPTSPVTLTMQCKQSGSLGFNFIQWVEVNVEIFHFCTLPQIERPGQRFGGSPIWSWSGAEVKHRRTSTVTTRRYGLTNAPQIRKERSVVLW